MDLLRENIRILEVAMQLAAQLDYVAVLLCNSAMKNIDLVNWKSSIGDTLQVRVTPKAAANRIKVEQQMDGSLLIRVYVTVTPEDGKANAAVLKLLAKELGVAKSSLVIRQGLTDRNKIIQIKK